VAELQVYLGGRLLPRSRALVPIDDAAFRHGEGVFETLRARGARAFRAERHLRGLSESAARIGWRLPWPPPEMHEALGETLRANGLPEARLRLQATPGRAGLDGASGEPLLLVDAARFPPLPADMRLRGVAVGLGPHRRQGTAAGAKTCSYLESLLARRAARAAGQFEAVLRNHSGEVCGAAMANLFAVRDGVLWTPPVRCGARAGVTRGVVLELARQRGHEVREEPFDLEALRSVGEIFLTSTGSEVLPVVRLDGRPVGDGRPGPVGREMADAYRRLLDDELGPVSC
jgi:branched-chain amino acid aminotransferase